MATRSFIARQTETGFEGVYCHWDGYLSHNGRVLREHYSDPEKLKNLIAGGDIFALAPEIGTQHDFRERPKGSTTFFHRDKGDSWKQCKSFRYKRLNNLIDIAEKSGCEFFYLFDGKTWQYAERGAQFFGLSDGSQFSGLKPLPDNLEE